MGLWTVYSERTMLLRWMRGRCFRKKLVGGSLTEIGVSLFAVDPLIGLTPRRNIEISLYHDSHLSCVALTTWFMVYGQH